MVFHLCSVCYCFVAIHVYYHATHDVQNEIFSHFYHHVCSFLFVFFDVHHQKTIHWINCAIYALWLPLLETVSGGQRVTRECWHRVVNIQRHQVSLAQSDAAPGGSISLQHFRPDENSRCGERFIGLDPTQQRLIRSTYMSQMVGFQRGWYRKSTKEYWSS